MREKKRNLCNEKSKICEELYILLKNSCNFIAIIFFVNVKFEANNE